MEKYSDSFVRNRFEDGMLLSASDLSNLQNYLNDKRRLGYCKLMGYGVVCGLTVKNALNCVTIAPGLAIDIKGREIYLPTEISVRPEDLFAGGMQSGKWFLCVEYAEEPSGEAFAISNDKLRNTIHNRIRETLDLTIKSSRDNGDICVASLTIEEQEAGRQISSIRSPVDSFHFSPMWNGLWPGHKYGSVNIGHDDLPEEGVIYITKEIDHGLGPGKDISIELSIKTSDQGRACEVFGSPDLFGLPVLAAAKLYPESGKFVIAVKRQAPLAAPVCIRWRARVLQGVIPNV